MKVGWTAALAVAMLASFHCSRSRPSPELDAPPDVAIAKAEPPDVPPDLSLFYSSDARGRVGRSGEGEGSPGGLSRRATVIDRARTRARAVIVVDAGDFLPSPTDPIVGDAGDAIEQRRSLVLASYKRMGVAAVVPGERELEIGSVRLGALLRSADVHPVAANIQTKKGELAFERDVIIETAAISVGIFGIFDPPPESTATLDRLGLTATDAVEAARTAAHSLRERGAGLVVGLLNVAGGAARAAEIVRQAGGIDIVVLGHGSDDLKPGVAATEGRTPIVYAGASDVGRIDLRSSDAGEPRLDHHTVSLTSAIPDHFGVGLLQLVEPTRQRIAQEKAAAAERKKKGQKEPETYESWTYGSNGACALCHTEAMQQWKTTDHAQAMAILRTNRRERDPACLGCHTTGYLQKGGTQNIDTALKQFAEVGCESCHGPSALHVRSIDKKKGTSLKVDATVCLGCHTPDQNLGAFDYEAARRAILGPGHGAPPPRR